MPFCWFCHAAAHIYLSLCWSRWFLVCYKTSWLHKKMHCQTSASFGSSLGTQIYGGRARTDRPSVRIMWLGLVSCQASGAWYFSEAALYKSTLSSLSQPDTVDMTEKPLKVMLNTNKQTTTFRNLTFESHHEKKLFLPYENNTGASTQFNQHLCHSLPRKYITIMILSFRPDRPGQTVQTQIRLLLKEQSDQGLHCLSFCLHRLDSLVYGKAT